MDKKRNKLSYICFRILRRMLMLCYPEYKIENMENIPNESCIIVGNHSQLHGPVSCELYLSDKFVTWCAGQMMHLKDVPSYSYQDFWSNKPKYIRWFYKGVSYIIAPLSVLIFNNARTIGVYRDSRIINTFRQTISELESGRNVIIFPECYEPYNNIVNSFQNRFTDVAKLYYKRTGKEVSFVPMYIAPSLKKIVFGKPVKYNHGESMDQERDRICTQLMESISSIAYGLPEHKVVPYANVSKRYYLLNNPTKEK